MISDKEYKKLLKQFHKLSDRHILVVETDMPASDVQKVVILSDKIRKAGNELVGLMRKNYDQLMRTKKYRKLLKLYGSTKDKKKHRDLANQLNEMQKQYNVTWDHCRNAMIHIGKKYSIDAVFALTKAEDIWRGIEKCLYNNGKTIHFSKYGELPCIRAKQINRGISMSVKDNGLKFKLKGNVFGIQVKDRFQTDEVCAVLEYLSRSEIINDKAINKFLDKAYCIDTYRPCYATLVPKFIRGKYRVYLHLTIEGKAKPKDEFVNQMRNLNALTQSLANRKLNDTLKETAEYENIEYKEMTLTDEKWKQIVDLLVQHKIGKCMLHIAVNDCGDTCWIDRKQYEKVKSGKASEDEKEELYDQIWGNTCGYCEISTNCQDLEYCNFMKQIKICGFSFIKNDVN